MDNILFSHSHNILTLLMNSAHRGRRRWRLTWTLGDKHTIHGTWVAPSKCLISRSAANGRAFTACAYLELSHCDKPSKTNREVCIAKSCYSTLPGLYEALSVKPKLAPGLPHSWSRHWLILAAIQPPSSGGVLQLSCCLLPPLLPKISRYHDPPPSLHLSFDLPPHG